MGLEEIVKKAMVISDVHIPFQDEEALEKMMKFIKVYKPDTFIINGDFIDCYNISTYDKNPERKFNFVDEITIAKTYLNKIDTVLPKNTKKYFIEGNHENRIQALLWRNPELEGLDDLKLPSVLKLKDKGYTFIGADRDYWKKTDGHLTLGNTIITHGDNRLNGCSTSRYSGYSAKNTMFNFNQSIIIGHVHRLAQVYHRNKNETIVGIEQGCLCKIPGTADWQHGFVTFEYDKKKSVNYQLHYLDY